MKSIVNVQSGHDTLSLACRLSVAPMMGYTDQHFRVLMRFITKRTLLYTEMITTGAILNTDPQALLSFNPVERPLALQLGGADPKQLAEAVKIANAYPYDEINLNVGCPSSRVKAGRFGACLMKTPELVADCIRAMREVSHVPVTVKCRIGVDQQETYPEFLNFVECVANAGCEVLIIHARKAWLKGLSPKQNRHVPPLKYDYVYQLKKDLPQLQIILNGGVNSLAEVGPHLAKVDGVMLGRAAYAHPFLFSQADEIIFGDPTQSLLREEVVQKYVQYMQEHRHLNSKSRTMVRHLAHLYQGQPGAKAWRQFTSSMASGFYRTALSSRCARSLFSFCRENYEQARKC